MKKYILPLTILLFVFQLKAQQELNNYKYIIIPESYDFVEGKDKYQLNSLTKFLFNREGYEAYIISDSLPQDLFNNRCLALSADAEKLKGGLFKTQIQINLKDCYGKLIYSSKVGSSKQKDFGKAYTHALRNAFETFEEFEYQYKPKTRNDVKIEENITQSQPKGQVVSEVAQKEGNKEVQTASYNAQIVEYAETSKNAETEAIKNKTQRLTESAAKTKDLVSENTYFAQTTESGYKLVDSEPKLIMELIRTAQKNTFSVKGQDAIVFKEEGFWYYSEIVDGKTIKTLLNIKFYD